MSRKRKEIDEAKDGEQFARFVEAAKQVGADDEQAFEDALQKILKAQPKHKKQGREGNGQTS